MSKEKPARGRLGLALALAAVAVVVVLAGVYVTVWSDGNGQRLAACSSSAPRAAALSPLTSGEMAAFAVAEPVLPAADIGFVAADGAARRLDKWRGRTVLVNLWATWCVPCKREMPALDKLQAELGSDRFEVVAINIDRGGDGKGKAFYEEIALKNLAFYHDPEGRIFRAARAVGMPTTFLVDRDGCEIGRLSGPAEWASEDAIRLIRAALAAG